MKINKNQVHCIIEARTNSTRLPNKVLKNLYKKHKAIDYVIQNLINSDIDIKNLIIAIPYTKKNDILQKYVYKKYKINVFRGSENNVYKRDFDCCKKFGVKNFMRMTADNLFVDPILINKALIFYLKNNLKYLSTRAMSHTNKWLATSDYNEGNSIEIINFAIFKKIKKFVSREDCEYPTWHLFSKPEIFKLSKFYLIDEYKKKIKKIKLKKIRTTLDTSRDLKFIKKVAQKLSLEPGKNNFLKILNNYNKIKKYLSINRNIKKKIAYQVIKNSK